MKKEQPSKSDALLVFACPDWFKESMRNLTQQDWRDIHREAARLKKEHKEWMNSAAIQ